MFVSETHFYQGTSVKVANFVLFNVDRPLIVGSRLSGGSTLFTLEMLSMQLSLKYSSFTTLKHAHCVRILLHPPAFDCSCLQYTF